ncbi:uncharacterized protein LOC108022220 [Drosophila biarmipes]|uniref:uncharacterized protein LOC108022220 n=1 Tax=Drosophila biarmipes TaxID=125945 RepID=UPI0007E7207C|nr:uncharacterized protein LOC108022220 [Drosophila biarmipes]
MSSFKTIEVDSDSSEVDDTMPLKRRETPPRSVGAKAKMSNEHTPKMAKVARTEPDSTSPSSSDMTNTSPGTGADVSGKAGRHRARKSLQGARRISPDLQFESVAAEGGEGGGASEASEAPEEPKLEGDSKDKVKTAIRNLLQTDEMKKIIRQIANERVRCNFLLATYQLPDMNFALNTSLDTLCIQFRERLKQRRDRENLALSAAAPSSSASSQKGPSKAVPKSQK